MLPTRPHRVALELLASRLALCPDGATQVPCLACAATIELHQPQEGEPDRMLGTCHQCSAWYLVECRPGGDAVMVLLPVGEAFWPALTETLPVPQPPA